MRGPRVDWWCGWFLAAAVLATSPGARAQEPAEPPWPEAPGEETPAPPIWRPGPPPRARGWLGLATGAVADAAGGGYVIRVSGGRVIAKRLRLDLVATGFAKKESFSADGLTVPGITVITRRFLQHDALSLGLALGWENGRFEPWVGAGFGVARVRAEVGGPGPGSFGTIFPGIERRSDTTTRSGPVLSAGANVILTRRLLLGLEVHEQLFPEARFDDVPVRATLSRPLLMVTFTARLGGQTGPASP